MVDYEGKIEKGKYRYITEEVDKRFDTSEPDWTKYVAVLHKMVADEVDYHNSGRQVPKASEMLDRLSGDCQDQTVLLSNLYVDAGLDVRIVSLTRMDDKEGHVLPQVKPPVSDTERGCQQLRNTYRDLFDTSPNEICFSTVHGSYYLIADPEWSSYVGDRTSLTGEYIEEKTGSGWKFHKLDYSGRVSATPSSSASTSTTSSTTTSSTSSTATQQYNGFFDQLDDAIDQMVEEI